VTSREDREYLALGTPPAADILLVVEVSDSTLDYDLNTKAPLYAAAGIPECWVVDVNARTLHRHTQPGATGYQSVAALPATASVIVNAVTLAIADLLP
jgi:Uma2 family endonuclease